MVSSQIFYLTVSIVVLDTLWIVGTQTVHKPPRSDWIQGRFPKEKLNLISWLIDGCYIYDVNPPTSQRWSSCDEAQFKERFDQDQHSAPTEFQSFDGFYNNIFKVDLGAVDTPLLRKVPSVYSDSVYEPVKGTRKNPFVISDTLMTRKPDCVTANGQVVACGSKTGKSAFLVYFGQQVVEEVLDAQRPGCPPEYFNIPIPPGHRFRGDHGNKSKTGKTEMPFLRSRYDQKTGHSPGNPRQQLNEITPWIDGGLIYGTSKAWSDVLRTDKYGHVAPGGQLASEDDEGLFPVKNKIRLPLANPPPPVFHDKFIKFHESSPVTRFFVLGNPRGNENAFLLSFGILLFRWHNQIASYLSLTRNQWSSERIFQESRKWVIATHQQIVLYNWLKEWLGEGIESYSGYNPALDPQIEQFFQTAAMRFGHTLVTPGAYMRDYACAQCKPISFYGITPKHPYKQPTHFSSTKTVRTCNIFWRPQEPITMSYDHVCTGVKDQRNVTDIDPLLMGMASQRCEREDNMIVEDLRGQVFGPLEFSRRDLMAVNIQRGRDHGTPDYNTARVAFGLPKILSVSQFINLTATATPPEILEKLEQIHMPDESVCQNDPESEPCFEQRVKAWDNIDVWTGGILETSDRPGPLFRAVIKDQFTRIRDADRFWFENRKWKEARFTEEEIERIKTLTIYDMVISVTRMLEEDLQQNPFRVPVLGDEGDAKLFQQCINPAKDVWQGSKCWKQKYDEDGFPIGANITSVCYHFAQLDSNSTPVEPCVGVGHYDYFSGSEVSYVLTFLFLGVFILGIASLVPMLVALRQKRKSSELVKIQKDFRRTFKISGKTGTPYAAREWISNSDGTRAVAVILTDKNCLEIYSHKNELLRSVDLSGRDQVELIVISDGVHLIIKNPTEYDCVLQFDGQLIRNSFANTIREQLGGVIPLVETTSALKPALATALTKHERLHRLERFFRIVFAQAFNIDKPSGSKNLLDPKTIREVIHTELTRVEFADALGMNTKSQFVEKMFGLVDRDRNGYISFREFLDMLVIFAKGSAEDKAQLMFEMYDIERTGMLSLAEFKNMIRSLIEAANADVSTDDVNDLVTSMMESAGLKRESQVSLADFQRILGQYKDTLGYAQLNFKGLNVPETKMGTVRNSQYESAREAVISVYGGKDVVDPPKESTQYLLHGDKDTTVLPSGKYKNKITTWFELYRLQIFWTLLFTLIVMAIFAERAYYYSVEREHGGLRQIAGYGVTVTRGAASVMMFCYSVLLLTMCRNMITNLRETFLHRYIPFDNFVKFHKYVAYIGLGFTVVHVIGHAINFYHISTQTAADLSCLFSDYYRATHILPKFHYWCFQTITGITGVLLVIHATLIYLFATTYARTYVFRMFWITHNTYPIFYVLLILHGSGRLVQEPLFQNFFLGPLILYILDRLVTTSRRKVEIPVLRAELLPSNVTKLEFARPTGFEYKSGQWVRIACLALNTDEYHPFTLSSAPHETSLTVHIRAVGPFTTNIRQIYERGLPLPKLYLDGPYGEGHQDWWRYEVAILVGGGIGVTPFASILKDVASNTNVRNCKKIYFLWVTKTQKQFEWMVDIIREVEKHKIISVHIFVTEIYDKYDLRTVLLYICERHFQKVNNKSLFTGLRAVSHFGRPNFLSFFRSLRTIHPNVLKFGVFSCGPLPMTKKVDDTCSVCNNDIDNRGAIFQHHFENF